MGDSDAHSYDSSPDPLAISFNNNKPTRKATPRRPLGSTSPSKQNRRSSVSEFEFSSPTKAMIMNTPRVGSASPWRIKVTVQAEPGSDDENAQSPTVERFTRTQTTTIPLKDPDASSPVKRGRGRPRKSDTGVVSRTKRAGTPIKRAPRSKSRDRSAGAVDASAADVDIDAPPKRKRGRPRKSIQPPVQHEDVVMTLDHSEPHREVTPVPAAKPKTSTSQKSTRFATPEEPISNAQTTGRRKLLDEHEMPVVDTLLQTKLGNHLRARKGTPHAKKIVPIALSSDEESEQESDVLTPTSGEEESPEEAMSDPFTSIPVPENTQRSSSQQPDMFENSPLDTVVPVVQVESYSGEPSENDDEEPQDVTIFAFDEGTTRMVDDTTVIDSENFSMISVDSLPSSGGLTSPPKPEDVERSAPQIGSMLRHEYLQPSVANATGSDAQQISPSLEVPRTSPGLALNEGSSRPTFRRYVTPIIDAEVPSMPPVIEPTQPVQPKTETPRLGRVVTAGVALQGVLDPSRLTPEPTQKMLDEKRDRLDDLFRGFSEGTRRELQAGLRLGEQLAEAGSKAASPHAPTSPIRSQPEPVAAPKIAVFKTHRKIREPRLLTPEDQDDIVVTAAPVQVEDVEYPQLFAPTEKSLPSPERSDDEKEMSWRVDTPPAPTGNSERSRLGNVESQNEEPHQNAITPTTAQMNIQTRQEDYSDIWQEEASRSSDSIEADVAQAEDLFLPSSAGPARGKLPRTWRRRNGNHLQHTDETASSHSTRPEPTPEAPETDGKEEQVTEEDDAGSDASDDTGMFFQSNMPNVFNKRHSRDLKQKKAEKLDLTMLLNEGESLAPESSPPVVANKISPVTNTNPFLNTPPRFPGYLSSPHKSSPLRREIRGSDISSEGPSRLFQEESSLPLPQSSPFHTIVDGESKLSIASDQRQLQMEMEGVTDSSICRVRNEADGYLDAYEPQERSLDEIEEVTEPSRTWLMKHSSPPRMKTLSPVRKRVSLFRDTPEKPRAAPRMHIEVETVEKRVLNAEKVFEPASSGLPTAVAASPEETSQERPSGLLTRMTSTLWSAVSKPEVLATPASSPPAPHPILAKLTALPKIEPWTKTHYKTLDKLYNVNQKHPALFSPSITPATPLSRTNAHLLNKFRSNNKQPYVGAVFSAWGYEFDMTEELVVLCQVFCELMSLDSIAAYEKLKGREIELGDCMPGKIGDVIEADEVMRRLATVILGEEVREDEKNGVKIDRSKGLEVHWPQGVAKRV
jgi:hypothetical protein